MVDFPNLASVPFRDESLAGQFEHGQGGKALLFRLIFTDQK